MKLPEQLEKLKAVRVVKTMLTLAIVSEFIFIGYVVTLPITTIQKVITTILAGVVILLALIAEDHLDKETYIDQLRDVAQKLDQEK